MFKKNPSATDVADLIQRFIEDKPEYPQEWNDFIESRCRTKGLEPIRQRCDELDPLVNRPGDPDLTAWTELKQIAETLRSTSGASSSL